MRQHIFFIGKFFLVPIFLLVFSLLSILQGQEASKSLARTRFSLWNSIDFLSQEKGYLYVKDVARALQSHLAYLPVNKKDMVQKLTASTMIVHFLQDPTSEFAPLYNQQIREKFQELVYIQSWAIYNRDKTPLLKSGQPPFGEEFFNEEMQLDENGFFAPVYSANELLGFVQGQWDIFLFPDLFSLPAVNSGLQSIYVNADGRIMNFAALLPQNKKMIEPYLSSSSSIKEKNETQADKQKYNGPLNGRQDSLRFYSISHPRSGNTVLFVYPAVSWLFYLYRFSLYIFLLLLLYVFLSFVSRHQKKEKEDAAAISAKDWSDEKLREAVSLNQDSLRFTQEGHRFFLHQKEKENEQWQDLRSDMHNISEKLDRNQASWKELFKSFFQSYSASGSATRTTSHLASASTAAHKKNRQQKPLLLQESFAKAFAANEQKKNHVANVEPDTLSEDFSEKEKATASPIFSLHAQKLQKQNSQHPQNFQKKTTNFADVNNTNVFNLKLHEPVNKTKPEQKSILPASLIHAAQKNLQNAQSTQDAEKQNLQQNVKDKKENNHKKQNLAPCFSFDLKTISLATETSSSKKILPEQKIQATLEQETTNQKPLQKQKSLSNPKENFFQLNWQNLKDFNRTNKNDHAPKDESFEKQMADFFCKQIKNYPLLFKTF